MTRGALKPRNERDLRELPRLVSIGEAICGWPVDRPLAVVCGGGPAWGRTILGTPRQVFRIESDGKARWFSEGKEETAPFPVGRGVMEDVRSALSWGRKATGGWVASFSYELGEWIEPAVKRKRGGGTWPLVEMQRCEEVAEFDHARARWRGEVKAGAARAFAVKELRSETGRERFEESVSRVIEYIRAGDVFQANIAHRLSGGFAGSARSAFARLWESARPWHGAYVEMDGGGARRALLSASPELFLKVERSTGQRTVPRITKVTTRPMKGTSSAKRDAAELKASGKDAAELNMIIDLMRNDLGRVCRFGSVRVEEARAIELHGAATGPHVEENSGVWQGVGTVVGELREGLDVVDLLAAAFPAGSVTGAPKIRAMQIIDELEASERGPYCGSIGWIGDDGSACLNVAIRTAAIEGEPGAALDELCGRASYSVGAGIVAESVPRREWEETLEKAGVMGGLTGRGD